MAFNPNVPINGTTVDADELRNQFNGLKSLIDTVPAGPQGEQGPPGPIFTWMGEIQPGMNVTRGGLGTFEGNLYWMVWEVGGGNPTLGYETTGWLRVSLAGPPGSAGPKGDTGEVSLNDMNIAIATRVQKPSSLGGLTEGVSDPPTYAEVMAIYGKVNEIVSILTSP